MILVIIYLYHIFTRERVITGCFAMIKTFNFFWFEMIALLMTNPQMCLHRLFQTGTLY